MTVVILDSNNLAMRSYHAAKHAMTSADGTETGSLQLFVTSLSRHLFELRPTHFVACWDGGGKGFRDELYPAYKAARRAGQEKSTEASHLPAFRLIWEALDLMGIAQWRQPGVEADDLIAAAWRQCHETEKVVILSSDKDMLQLLDHNTSQIRFSSHNTPTDLWTRERVIVDLGYTPEQIPLVMALTGDQSDGIPGVRGIGPKKAVKLLQAHDWDASRAIRALPTDQVVMAETSRLLVDLLDKDHCVIPQVPGYAPLSRWSPNAHDRFTAFTEFCATYQLRTLWERLLGGSLW